MAESALPYLSRVESVRYIEQKYGQPARVSAGHLAKLAVKGGGPKFRRFGPRKVGYLPNDIDEWIETRISRVYFTTSEYVAPRVKEAVAPAAAPPRGRPKKSILIGDRVGAEAD
jgi:hypothetical protein